MEGGRIKRLRLKDEHDPVSNSASPRGKKKTRVRHDAAVSFSDRSGRTERERERGELIDG